ncbi:MAG: RagB/SusD family nutrient uptake outer membrane protein [Bacteroidia bacterium]
MKKYSLVFLFFMLLSISCKKDFLDVKPQGNLTSALFPQSAADALLAVNAVYGSMHDWNIYSGGYPIADLLSDDAEKGSNPGDQSHLNLYKSYQFTPSIEELPRWYAALYKGIKFANVVNEKVSIIEMDVALRTRYIAEARFFRAMFYFNLVRAFGDVPKVINLEAERKMPRSPKQEIYNEIIIPDLEYAIVNLPSKNSYGADDIGRASKGAAQSLMAKVYLYLADYTKAEQYAMDVINTNDYALMPQFTDAFSVAGQYGSESIFEVGAREFENTAQGGNQYANTQGVRGAPNKGWGFNRPSVDLANFFEPGDARNTGTIISLGDIIDGVLIVGDISTPDITYSDPPTNSIIKEKETYNRKVWTPGTNTSTEWGHNIRIIRYAEVLLIASEALVRNGNSGQALIYINQIRQRAGLGALATVDLDVVYKERRAEMAMESDRFYDLLRTGRAAQVLGPLGFVAGKNELFPIPQSEIDLSEGALTQNPGW